MVLWLLLKIIDVKRAVVFALTILLKVGLEFNLVDGIRAFFVLEWTIIVFINSAWRLICKAVVVDSNSQRSFVTIITIYNLGDGSIFACHYYIAQDEWEGCTLNGRITLVTKRVLAIL